MRYLRVRLTGEDAILHPLVGTLTDGDVFREAMMVDWSASFDPPRSTVLLYLDGDLDAFGAVLADTDVVLEADVTRFGDGRGYAYVHCEPHPTEWALFDAFTGEGLIVVSPIVYGDAGAVTVRIVGSVDRLRTAIEAVPEGVDTSIERVGEYDLGRPAIPPALPARQREALDAAVELGYYEVPREATRDDVAARLGCAPSTASEHLRKAERRIVRSYVDG